MSAKKKTITDRKTRVSITHQQFFQLCEWVKTTKGRVHTCQAAYDKACEELPFNIAASSIYSARDAVGATWLRKHNSGGARVYDPEHIIVLAKAVQGLYRAGGYVLPHSMRDLLESLEAVDETAAEEAEVAHGK